MCASLKKINCVHYIRFHAIVLVFDGVFCRLCICLLKIENSRVKKKQKHMHSYMGVLLQLRIMRVFGLSLLFVISVFQPIWALHHLHERKRRKKRQGLERIKKNGETVHSYNLTIEKLNFPDTYVDFYPLFTSRVCTPPHVKT